jgi:biotin transport system permease protein
MRAGRAGGLSRLMGLYVPGRSILHRAPAWAKLGGLLCVTLAASVPPPNWWLLCSLGGLVLAMFLVTRLAGRLVIQLWAMRWMLVVVLIPQLIFLAWPVAVATTARILIAITAASLVTLTTRTSELLAVFERVLMPLRRVGVNPVRVSLVLAMTIRTVPVIAERAEQVREAQRARGRYSLRGFVVPLLVGSLRHADELADALAARGVED